MSDAKARPSTSKFDTALFDFDGTVMDTNGLIIETWRYTVRTLADREMSMEEIQGTLGEAIAVSMPRILPDIDPAVSTATYRNYQADRYLDAIRLFDGTEDTLRALRERGVRTGLVTNRLANSTYRALDHFGVRGDFDIILTAEDYTRFKPDPEPILLTLARLGADPARTIYLGDSVNDILAAKAAGVYAILAGWSVALPEEKREDGAAAPDLVIEHMGDLLELF
jgi:pyrophosphatase PpaX